MTDKLANCPLCHSPPVVAEANALLVSGVSCSNHNCILAAHNQDDLNRHLTVEEWPKEPPTPRMSRVVSSSANVADRNVSIALAGAGDAQQTAVLDLDCIPVLLLEVAARFSELASALPGAEQRAAVTTIKNVSVAWRTDTRRPVVFFVLESGAALPIEMASSFDVRLLSLALADLADLNDTRAAVKH